MKFRVACKVCKAVFCGESRQVRYRSETVEKAIRICQRKWPHDRVPYLPSDGEEISGSPFSFDSWQWANLKYRRPGA